jgi:hypothetical protein
LRDEIDSALADLAAKLEAEDADRCRRFGVPPSHSDTTRLVHAVRLQFGNRTFDLKRFAKLHAGAPCSPFVEAIFNEFLDLRTW